MLSKLSEESTPFFCFPIINKSFLKILTTVKQRIQGIFNYTQQV